MLKAPTPLRFEKKFSAFSFDKGRLTAPQVLVWRLFGKPKRLLKFVQSSVSYLKLVTAGSQYVKFPQQWSSNLCWEFATRHPNQRYWRPLLQIWKDCLYWFKEPTRAPICVCWIWRSQVICLIKFITSSGSISSEILGMLRMLYMLVTVMIMTDTALE